MTSRTSPDPAAVLRDRAAQTLAQRDALREAITAMRTARSLTFADDEHDPEGSTVSLDQARDTALLQQSEHTLAEIRAASDRLAAGTYGVCEQCGRAIPEPRLAARPEARSCVSCAEGPSNRRS